MRVRGSITVEATFLFPILFFVIMTLLYVSFYLYDVSVIQSKLDESLLDVQLMIRQPMNLAEKKIDYSNVSERSMLYKFQGSYEQEKEKIKLQLLDYLHRSLTISRIHTISLERGMNGCEGSITVKMNLHILPVLSYLWSSEYIVSGKVKEHDPIEFIRRYDAMQSIVSDVKGYEQLRGRVQAILDKVR